MTFMRRPRVFLSYRHEERSGFFARRYNTRHRAWIHDFAHALAAWNVDVIWDDRLRDLFRPHTTTDPATLPFLAEVSTLCLQSAQAFMPIVTRGYLERIADDSGHGTVTEEWKHGVAECAAGRAELVTIVREWPIEGVDAPSAPIASHNSWDFRFVAPNKDEVELLGDALHGVWHVERPAFDQSFAALISAYLKFCVSAFKLPWPGVERWGCVFERPRIFLEHQARIAALNPPAPAAGSQRDMDEFLRAFGDRIPHATPDTPLPPPGDAAEEKHAEEQAKALARSVFAAHIERHRKPFAFDEKAPGGRASKGLYFGPTRPGFSYLHPVARGG